MDCYTPAFPTQGARPPLIQSIIWQMGDQSPVYCSMLASGRIGPWASLKNRSTLCKKYSRDFAPRQHR